VTASARPAGARSVAGSTECQAWLDPMLSVPHGGGGVGESAGVAEFFPVNRLGASRTAAHTTVGPRLLSSADTVVPTHPLRVRRFAQCSLRLGVDEARWRPDAVVGLSDLFCG